MAHPKHEQVRQRYQQRCGYCTVSEVDAGGELSVDHFQPKSDGGDESDDNLVYACFRCNFYKSQFSPTAVDRAAGRRLLHPLLEDFSQHIVEDPQTGVLVPKSETGRFHINILHLNREALVRLRLRRRLIALCADQLELFRRRTEQLTEAVAKRDAIIEAMRIQIRRIAGSDE